MIRNAFRAVLAVACLFSLLLCLGAGWLWWQSAHGRLPSYVRIGRAGNGLRVGHDRVTLLLPPRVGDPAAADRARELVHDSRDGQSVDWRVAYVYRGPGTPPQTVALTPRFDPSNFKSLLALADSNDPAPTVPLLEAVDDPDRFLFAHFILMTRATGRTDQLRDIEAPVRSRDGRPVADLGGLTVTFVAAPGRDSPSWQLRADPSQLPRLHDYWLDRLSVPGAAVPYWVLAAACALPPLLWLGTAGRRTFVTRRRRRLGRCLGCGYDLTGNASGTCPECGTT